ncbi:hypothetical protein [Streptomyces tsukubensis]|uniref:hypothetical protein n=1 Tax=Streptomyces tsukubensis TaxID=83656 RepID=UPI00351CD287
MGAGTGGGAGTGAARAGDEAHRDVEPAALAAGERRARAVEQSGETQLARQFRRAPRRRPLREPVQPAHIGREMAAGRPAAEVSRDALDLLDDMEELLGEPVLRYATRGR